MSIAYPKGRIMRGLFAFAIFFCVVLARAQTPIPAQPASESQLSPENAYKQAIRPLEITRRDPQNWSEVELNALKVARENAKAECLALNPEKLAGADLLGFAHLCAFAEQWEEVHLAASNYISAAESSNASGSPKSTVDFAKAFDYKIQSSLKMNNVDEASADCQTMMRSVSYDIFTSEATNSTINAIRFSHIDQALALLHQRQPIILSEIRQRLRYGPDSRDANVSTPVLDSPLPLHTLYADAIALPSLDQFADQPKAAASAFGQLESALPANVAPSEAMYIEQQRRQYQLLGDHLPALYPTGSLLSPGASSPQGINSFFAHGAVFLLFPDWCNQCIAMGPDATQKGKELVAADNIRFFLLMSQANPPEEPTSAPVKNVPLSTKTAQATLAHGKQLHVDQQLRMTSEPDTLLLGTPTVVVPNETLSTFAATDFPVIIATDHNGIVRWIDRAQDNAFDPGGEIDEIVKVILSTWTPQ